MTNFVVLRIDHIAGAANDNAYLFVNPALNVEPAVNNAGASSTNGFDFSFNQLRIFAGGQSSAAQPTQKSSWMNIVSAKATRT